MPETDIGSTKISEITAALANQANVAVQPTFKIDSQQTDAGGDQKEFTYQNTMWAKWLGYYKSIPELKIAVDTKANWVIGNGYEADEQTTLLLDTIKGSGKDSFNSILENMERCSYFGEDSYAEIIRDRDDVFANLKTLSPDTIVVVTNRKNRILRYEQVSRTEGAPNRVIDTENMFVLTHNRIADEIHGTSIIPALQFIIDARNEVMHDWKRVLHRNITPLIIWHLDTDDPIKIADFKTKNTAAKVGGEDMYIPKGTVVPEIIATAQNQTLNPLATIEIYNDYFYQAVGVPQIIVGNAKAFTDASGKIVYLAFEQRIKGRQLYVEEQVLGQLNVEIQLTFPASLQSDAISDTPSETDLIEEEPIEQAAQPNDTTEELEGKT